VNTFFDNITIIIMRIQMNAVQFKPTFIVHPQEMFLEAVGLRFAADNPVVVNDAGAGWVIITAA